LSGVRASFVGMSIIEERRTEIRAHDVTYQIAVATRTDGDRAEPNTRVMVTLEAGGPGGEPIAEGSLDLDIAVAGTVAELMADTLLSAAGGRLPKRRSGARPSQQGRPWTEEMDAELESRWLAGESVEQIAAWFDAAGLMPARTETLKGGELTVKLWLARKAEQTMQKVKAA